MATPVRKTKKKPSLLSRATHSVRWVLGLVFASTFSLTYFVVPFYMITALLALTFGYPCRHASWLYASPLFISAIVPPIPMPFLLKLLRPILDYFEFEEIHENSPVDLRTECIDNGKNYLCVFQPHGALSYTAIASIVNAPPEFQGKLKTAVADAVLYTPILKHVMGIFGLVSASKKSMIETLKKPGIEGSICLYVGGMAELFLSCEKEEIIYLNKRKGFIKLALTQGVDVVPIYLFGNTTVLSVLKIGLLSKISRKYQVSLTYIWGRWGLPIPRPCKLLYVTGQPLGMPKIENPTQEDIDHWHAEYCKQVTRLFDTYKERVPEYKHKKLTIV